jgi:hypothetical protein
MAMACTKFWFQNVFAAKRNKLSACHGHVLTLLLCSLTDELMFAFAVAILLARIYGRGWLRHILERIFGTGGQQIGESRTTELEMNTRPPPRRHRRPQTSKYLSLSTLISALSSNNSTEPAAPLPSLLQTESEIVEGCLYDMED